MDRLRHGLAGFLAYPEGRTIRNSAKRLGPKLDTRGEGGYVVVPPSRHPSGNLYQWAPDRSPASVPPEAAPAWLVDLLDPPVQPEAQQAWTGHQRSSGGSDDRYILRAIEAELALVASAPVGKRNDSSMAAFNLFRFAAEGRIDAGAIAHGLEAAALHAGLDAREIASTSIRRRQARSAAQMTDFDPRATARATVEQGKRKGNGPAAPEQPPLIMLSECKIDTELFWAIDDLLPRCSMMIVYARGGSGKTYLMTSVSIGIASGQWFSYEAEKGPFSSAPSSAPRTPKIASPLFGKSSTAPQTRHSPCSSSAASASRTIPQT